MSSLNSQDLKIEKIHLSVLPAKKGSVKYYLFFLYLNPLKTLILREICNKKSIDLPFRV